MTEPTNDREATAEVLDALGAAAVGESPPPPDAPTARVHRGRPHRRNWLAAAAAVVLLGTVGVWWTAREDPVEQVAGPDPSASSVPGPPAAADVDLEIEIGRPSGPDGAMSATITNRGDRPVWLDCAAWRLDRWDGREWQTVAVSALWDQDGRLAMLDYRRIDDCGGANDLRPGATVSRPLVPGWATRSTGRSTVDRSGVQVPEPLTPGTYRLVLPAGPSPTVQVEEPITADARFVIGPDDVPPTTVPPDCEPVTRAELAELLGTSSAAPPYTLPGPTVPITAPMVSRCVAESGEWSVGYEIFEVDPAPSGDMAFGEEVAVGDDAYVDVSIDRSGLGGAEGYVRVGDRAASIGLSSAASGPDTYPPTDGAPVLPVVRERAIALLSALAERL